jgi:4-hydroxy-4-methyl-2-oxoglutarate aldolase
VTELDTAGLLAWGAATLHEACPVPNALPANLRPAWLGARVAGRAYPVLVAPGDNLALHWALVSAGPGDVIVADAHDAEHGHWGEVMAVQAVAAGLAGLVIAGGVRDTDQQCDLGFPVFSSSVTVRGTAKRWVGVQGAPIVLGGVVVSRGDVIVGDADGVVVIPADVFPETVERATARVAKEDRIMAALRAGSTTLDEYSLRGLGDPLID